MYTYTYTYIIIWNNVNWANISITAANILWIKQITCCGGHNSKIVPQISWSLPNVCIPCNSWNCEDDGFYCCDELFFMAQLTLQREISR